MDGRFILFAGTTEGRMLAEVLGRSGADVLVCVATEFGKGMIKESRHVTVSSERLGDEGIRRIMGEDCIAVIDATHPYAVNMSGKIRDACAETGRPLIRIIREDSRISDDVLTFPDIDSAVSYLNGTEGNILVTTGSKELGKYTSIAGYRDRVFARVLSMPDASRHCSEVGFEGKNLICMQGPFCEDLNYGMLKQIDARYMVTKDSGEPGGFYDKIKAAERAGTKVILIGRPDEHGGHTYEDALKILKEEYGLDIPDTLQKVEGKRKITVVGMGMGSRDTTTQAAERAISEADLIMGAERLVRSVSNRKDTVAQYDPGKIMQYLEEHPEYKNAVVLVSGDTGFHSATKGILEKADRDGFDVDVVCGISSISYFCSKIGRSWDDAYLMSAHGRDANIIGNAIRHGKVIVLLDGPDGAAEMCRDLSEFGMDDADVIIGQDMGMPEERIDSGRPRDLADRKFGRLCIAMVESRTVQSGGRIGIRDEEFIRGDAPMTKSEVRALSVAKLQLDDDSVAFDIGAGTGSVSVEIALNAPNGRVFSIEKEKDAVQLIAANRLKFKVPNLTVVEGRAPEVLKGLPMPTHAFIGGTSGDLREIMLALLETNPKIRMVVNAITLETVSEMIGCGKDLGDLMEEEEMVSVNVSRSRDVGGYHLMSAQNPVYIGVFKGKGQR